MRYPLLWCLLLISPRAENYVRIESPADGRNYTVDLDSTAVQRALRPVTEAALAGKLPRWLYPSTEFKPSNLHWDPVSGVIGGTFAIAGTVESVTTLYEQLLGTHGLRVSSLPYRGSPGLQITGSSAAETVTIQIQPQATYVHASATYAPRDPTRQQFDVVWYDDSSGQLRVKDRTGNEFQLNKSGIVSNNLNRPGGVVSEGAAMPSWLAVYPGSSPSPRGRIKWMFTPTAEFLTSDAIRTVYEYYRGQVQEAGAMIKSSGINRSGTPLRDFDAYVIAIKGDDQVEIRIGEVVEMGVPTNTRARTGIGIQYSIPKR